MNKIIHEGEEAEKEIFQLRARQQIYQNFPSRCELSKAKNEMKMTINDFSMRTVTILRDN